MRASERYLVLEFGFDLNQWCSGVGTCRKGVPTPLFVALHPCIYVETFGSFGLPGTFYQILLYLLL